MTIQEQLLKAKNKLTTISASPLLDAEVLISKTLKVTREYLITHQNKEITNKELRKINKLVNRRRKSEPIAYILHQKEFFGMEFFVNKNVLIPRPETELLVEKALEIIKKNNCQTLIDVGTGSGCIAIACAKNLKNKVKIIAIDNSPKSLYVAKKNSNKHNTEIGFICSDLLEKAKLKRILSPIIFTCNLPYIPEGEKLMKDVEFYEPKNALFASKKGVFLYQRLFAEIAQKAPDFSGIVFEFDPKQVDLFKSLQKRFFSNRELSFFQDYSGKLRIGVIS